MTMTTTMLLLQGEAQIAVVDLLGILTGVVLSKAVGTSRLSMGITYITLSMIDIFAIYNEIRCVGDLDIGCCIFSACGSFVHPRLLGHDCGLCGDQICSFQSTELREIGACDQGGYHY